MQKARVFVVRHGQSTHNRDHIVSGHVNPSLTDEGKEQVIATKAKLAKVHFDEVYSSDLERAVHTATIIQGAPVPESHQFRDLRERNFGYFDGKHDKHLQKLHEEQQKIYDAMSEEERWKHKRAPDFESDHEVSSRFLGALTKLASENLGKTILVAAHGGTLRILLIKLGYGTRDNFPPGSIQNAAFVELDFDGHNFTVERTEGVNKQE